MSPDLPSFDHDRVGSGFRTGMPPEARRRFAREEGSELIVEIDQYGVHFFTLEQLARRSAAMLARCIDPKRILSEELIADRRAEAARERDE